MRISKSEFNKRMNNARKMVEKAQFAEDELFEYLYECFPNTELEDLSSGAENADNIKHAITCYLSYGEYSIDKIYNELKEIGDLKDE